MPWLLCTSTMFAVLLLFALLASSTLMLFQCCCFCQKKKNQRNGRQVVTKAPNSRIKTRETPVKRAPVISKRGGEVSKAEAATAIDGPVDSLTCGIHRAGRTNKSTAITEKTKMEHIHLSKEACQPQSFKLSDKERDIKEHGRKKENAAVDPYPTISVLITNSSKSK